MYTEHRFQLQTCRPGCKTSDNCSGPKQVNWIAIITFEGLFKYCYHMCVEFCDFYSQSHFKVALIQILQNNIYIKIT